MAIAYEYRPGRLYLNVTHRCSNACTFCVRQGSASRLAGHDLRLPREPDTAEVLEAIDAATAARGRAFDEVVFCGFGEPTYRLDLLRAVGRTLRRQGVPVRLNTNGQAALTAGGDPLTAGGDPVAALQGAVDHVSVSLNAPDAARYVALCRPQAGPAAWEALLGFCRDAVAHLPRVTLTVVGFTLEDEELERCESLADELGAELRVR
jgi:TatD DNase family protein